MKNTLDKLHGFIGNMVSLLEDEVDELKASKSKTKSGDKKNITDTINKLVSVITQLNKLSKEDDINSYKAMPEEDKEIIDRFLNKHKK